MKPKDGQYGKLKPDGTWTGMIGMLNNKEIDIAFPDFVISNERKKYVSFMHTLATVRTTFFIKAPSDSFNYQAYTEPLTNLAWIIILVFATIAPMVLYTSVR